MKSTLSKVIIVLSVLSLAVQIFGGIALIHHINKPLHLNLIGFAILLELAAFFILSPYMRTIYKQLGVKIGVGESVLLIFASEGYSHLLPFGDYIAQRIYFTRTKRPSGPIVDYIVVLYSGCLVALASMFIVLQLFVSVLFPNKITGSFAGKFAYIPFAFTLLIFSLLLARKSVKFRRRVTDFCVRYFKEPLRSPIAILKGLHLSSARTLLLISPLFITWVVEGLGYVCCLYAFNVHAPMLLCLYVYSFVKVFRFIPIFPGGVGEIETVSSLLFSSYGYAIAPVIGGSILFRLVSYWLPISIGAGSYFALFKRRRVLT